MLKHFGISDVLMLRHRRGSDNWIWAGIVWLFGRVIYVFGYWSAPPRRQPGFILAMIALVLLLILTAYGLFRMGLVMGV